MPNPTEADSETGLLTEIPVRTKMRDERRERVTHAGWQCPGHVSEASDARLKIPTTTYPSNPQQAAVHCTRMDS